MSDGDSCTALSTAYISSLPSPILNLKCITPVIKRLAPGTPFKHHSLPNITLFAYYCDDDLSERVPMHIDDVQWCQWAYGRIRLNNQWNYLLLLSIFTRRHACRLANDHQSVGVLDVIIRDLIFDGKAARLAQRMLVAYHCETEHELLKPWVHGESEDNVPAPNVQSIADQINLTLLNDVPRLRQFLGSLYALKKQIRVKDIVETLVDFEQCPTSRTTVVPEQAPEPAPLAPAPAPAPAPEQILVLGPTVTAAERAADTEMQLAETRAENERVSAEKQQLADKQAEFERQNAELFEAKRLITKNEKATAAALIKVEKAKAVEAQAKDKAIQQLTHVQKELADLKDKIKKPARRRRPVHRSAAPNEEEDAIKELMGELGDLLKIDELRVCKSIVRKVLKKADHRAFLIKLLQWAKDCLDDSAEPDEPVADELKQPQGRKDHKQQREEKDEQEDGQEDEPPPVKRTRRQLNKALYDSEDEKTVEPPPDSADEDSPPREPRSLKRSRPLEDELHDEGLPEGSIVIGVPLRSDADADSDEPMLSPSSINSTAPLSGPIDSSPVIESPPMSSPAMQVCDS